MFTIDNRSPDQPVDRMTVCPNTLKAQSGKEQLSDLKAKQDFKSDKSVSDFQDSLPLSVLHELTHSPAVVRKVVGGRDPSKRLVLNCTAYKAYNFL